MWFELSSLWTKSYGVTIQIKATEQYVRIAHFLSFLIFDLSHVWE